MLPKSTPKSGTLGQPNALTLSEDFEFSALARAYHYLRAILKEFCPFLRGLVLDVGVGIGQITELIAQMVGPGNIHAVKPDPRFAARLRSRLPQPQVFEPQAASMSLDTISITVISINVLKHIEDHVGESTHYRNWLAQNRGFLCLLVPVRREIFSASDKDFGHFRSYTRFSLAAVLSQSGFTVHRL